MSDLPTRIQLKQPETFFAERGIRVPQAIYRQQPFRFKPQTFAVGGSRMKEKIYNPSVQEMSLQGFVQNPLQPVVYGVGAQSDPLIANYFAAFLVQKFCENTHASNIVQWLRPSDVLGEDTIRPSSSLVVVSGLSPNTPEWRRSKVADLLDENDGIPRIVVITGEDPITYFATRLFYKVDRVFFHDENAVKRNVEVI
jgi:hypothetical protein